MNTSLSLNNSSGIVFGHGTLHLVGVLRVGVRHLVALEPHIAHEVSMAALGGLLAVPPEAFFEAVHLIPVGDMEVHIMDSGGH